MKAETPHLSIVIPVYNEEGILRGSVLELQEKHSIIGEVRGMGLMLGIELVQDRKTKAPATTETAQIMEASRENRILLGKGGLYGNVLRISPALNVTREDADQAADIIDQALAEGARA